MESLPPRDRSCRAACVTLPNSAYFTLNFPRIFNSVDAIACISIFVGVRVVMCVQAWVCVCALGVGGKEARELPGVDSPARPARRAPPLPRLLYGAR